MSGDGFADNVQSDNFPIPTGTGLSLRASLSDVCQKFSNPAESLVAISPDKVKEIETADLDLSNTENLMRAVAEILEGKEEATGKDDISNRLLLQSQIKIMVDEWFARIPLGQAYNFTENLIQFANQFIRSLPPETAKDIDRRSENIMWERIRTNNVKKVLVATELANKPLTYVSDIVNIRSVSQSLPKLLERLKHATRERGKKSILAKFLGVSLVQVSQWLSGDREPGGETTLKMLYWVEQQERQK